MLTKYQVDVYETLKRSVVVRAVNEEQAIQIIRKRYYAEELVLNADDCMEVAFDATKLSQNNAKILCM